MFQNPSKTKAKQNVNRVSNEIQSDTPCWRRDHTIKDNPVKEGIIPSKTTLIHTMNLYESSNTK